MSTSPDLVQTLSRWLAGHVGLDEVRAALADPGELGPEARGLTRELREELDRPDASDAQLQALARETIEAVALGE